MLFFDDDLNSEINSELDNEENIDINKRKSDKKYELTEKRDIKDNKSKILIRRTEKKKNKSKEKLILAATFLISLLLFFSIIFNPGFFDKFRAFLNLNEKSIHLSEGKEENSFEEDGLNKGSKVIEDQADLLPENKVENEVLKRELSANKDIINTAVNKDESAQDNKDQLVENDEISQNNKEQLVENGKIVQNNINNENDDSGLLYSISEISDPFFEEVNETKEAEVEIEAVEDSAEQSTDIQSTDNNLSNLSGNKASGSLIESEEDIIEAVEEINNQNRALHSENTALMKDIENSEKHEEHINDDIETAAANVNQQEKTGDLGSENKDNENTENINAEKINAENINREENKDGIENNEFKNTEVEKVELKIPFTLRGTILNSDQAEALFFYNNSLISRKVGEKIENFKIVEITKKEVIISFMDFKHSMYIWGHDKVEAAE